MSEAALSHRSTPIRLALAAGLCLALGACSSLGSMFGGDSDAAYANVSASPAQVAQAAPEGMPAIATQCPPIRVRTGTGSYRIYAGNRESDPQALRYQGVIDRVSRNCVASNGVITVQMGAIGRVVPGPSSAEGSVTVPLRFAVERDGLVTFSELYQVPVTISQSSANQFSYTVEDVGIPYVGGEDIVIWVGFDA